MRGPLDSLGAERGRHRRVHGVGIPEVTEQEQGASATPMPCFHPDGNHPCDVALKHVSDGRGGQPLLQIHGHVVAERYEPRRRFSGDRTGRGTGLAIRRPELGCRVLLCEIFEDGKAIPDDADIRLSPGTLLDAELRKISALLSGRRS